MKDLFGLEDEPALVVGGGYGSGRLLALLLARAGARVAVVDIDRGRATAVADEVAGHAIVADVRSAKEAADAVDEAHRLLGGLTRVANIVGLVDMRPFAETDPEQWNAQLGLNLLSQVNVCHASGRHLLADGRGGSIAMVASVSGIYGARNQALYGAGKAGVMSLARTLADEWGPHGVRVNCVAPDITAVPRLTDAMNQPLDQALAGLDAMAVAEGVPMRRMGRPQEIAGPLLFLLSELSSFMTGQTLVVDGGTMVHSPTTPVVTGHSRSGDNSEPRKARRPWLGTAEQSALGARVWGRRVELLRDAGVFTAGPGAVGRGGLVLASCWGRSRCTRLGPSIAVSCSPTTCSRICSCRARGGPSFPADVMATVIVLQALAGLSDRQAVGRLETDIAWKAAAGLGLADEAFHSTAGVVAGQAAQQ